MTAALVAVFGSEQLTHRAADADRSLRPVLTALTNLPTWGTAGQANAGTWALAAKLATLLVAVGVLARIVATAGSRTSAFLAGWAAAVLSSALAAVVSLQLSALLLAGPDEPANGVPATADAVDRGAQFGLYTGWLVGLAIAATVASTRRPVPRTVAARKPVAPKGSPHPGTKAKGKAKVTAKASTAAPKAAPTWPPRPRIGTALPNPAWTAAGLHQEPPHRPKADANGVRANGVKANGVSGR